MTVKATSLCLILALSLTACSTNKETGILAGALAGAAAGSQVGDGSGTLVAIAVGAIVGGFAGAAIGERLDEADKIKKEAAARESASGKIGDAVRWTSGSQPMTYGYSEPVTAPVTAPPTKIFGATVNSESTCRMVREVVVIQGKESKEETEYCLKNSGWVRS